MKNNEVMREVMFGALFAIIELVLLSFTSNDSFTTNDDLNVLFFTLSLVALLTQLAMIYFVVRDKRLSMKYVLSSVVAWYLTVLILGLYLLSLDKSSGNLPPQFFIFMQTPVLTYIAIYAIIAEFAILRWKKISSKEVPQNVDNSQLPPTAGSAL